MREMSPEVAEAAADAHQGQTGGMQAQVTTGMHTTSLFKVMPCFTAM